MAWIQLPALRFQLRGHLCALLLDGCHPRFTSSPASSDAIAAFWASALTEKGSAVRRGSSAMAGAATA
ncbi:hypothetical protein [Arthrobacter sp. B3I4]|uniref:hypothetical protein n=1 Tax=Arthrobacter sp. B3I4 TaxID=3042267 RepID=UPI0027D78437|nr:hypothetical protein [Arthrobacter sp. B3I4]